MLPIVCKMKPVSCINNSKLDLLTAVSQWKEFSMFPTNVEYPLVISLYFGLVSFNRFFNTTVFFYQCQCFFIMDA